MEIKVFGPGCARCAQTEQLVKDVVASQGLSATVTKVTDMKEMMLAGIMSTPAVAIDGVVKSTGKIPTKEDVITWLLGAKDSPAACCSPTEAAASGVCSCGGKC